jgi:hypothetical protein
MADDIVGLAAIPDAKLAAYIARSESAIDAFVGFNLLGNGGFEPHTMGMVQQGFDFSTRKLRIPSPIVPVRTVDRIRIHISNTGGGTDTGLYAILEPSEVVINNWEGYCEIIALTLTYSMSAVIWELGLNPPIAEWDLEVGYYLPHWGETLYDSGDATTFYALRQHWASSYVQSGSSQPSTLPPVPPVIYVNGVPQAACTLSAALVANTPYTSLAVTPLAQALTNGAQLVVNGGQGSTAITVTLSGNVSAGATTLPIASWTPLIAYPAGTVVASGYSVNYKEGAVTFTAKQSGNPTITADLTAQIPDLVRDACIEQVTYLLIQRTLNQAGMGGLEQVKTGDQFARRSKSDDAEEDQLCAKARLKLAGYVPAAIA